MEGNRHYIEADGSGRILSGWSDGPFPDKDTSGAVVQREDGGYQFRLFPGGEENPPLANGYGVPLYTYSEGEVIPVPVEEVEKQTQKIIEEIEEDIREKEEQKGKEKSILHQMKAAASFAVMMNTNLSDDQAMQIPDLFPVWPDGTNPDGYYIKGQVVKDGTDNALYRVVPEQVKPLESQPPHGEGMLSVYRPVEQGHAGTEEDPIPWVYGMDCRAGQYFSWEGRLYRVAAGGDMVPCVWPPDTAGLWQWEPVGQGG